MLKKFCDVCGQEVGVINPNQNKMTIINSTTEEYDICWDCQTEIKLFLKEQCKYHSLTNTGDALSGLNL